MKLKLLIPILLLGLGAVIFATRRAEYSSLKKQLTEKENLSQKASLTAITSKDTTRKAGPKVDAIFLRNASDYLFTLQSKNASGENLSEEEMKEIESQIAKMRAQLTYAKPADIFELIPPDFSFETFPPETSQGAFAALILNFLEEVNTACYLEVMTMATSNLQPFAFSDKPTALTRSLLQWGIRSPDEAYAWYRRALQEQNPLLESEEFQKSRLGFLAPTAPQEAISEMLALEVENEKDFRMNFRAPSFTGDEPELEDITRVLSAFESQSSLHPGSERLANIRDSFIADISGDLADRGFREASAYLDQHFTDADKARFFGQMAGNTFQEQKLWLDYGMKDELSPVTIGDLVRSWSGVDPTSAGQWLTEQQEGPQKEAAIYEYANLIAKSDPAIARQWAETLPNSRKRKRILNKVRKQLAKTETR